jgi:precorrin-6B methylase 2
LEIDAVFFIVSAIILICLIALSWFAGTDAPYVPTKNIRIKKILKEVKLKKGQTFYELGSGDGRVVLEAARLGVTAFGIEQSLLRVFYSKWQAHQLNLDNAHFIHGDIFKKDFSTADIIFIFLLPGGIQKLEPILKKNLKKGSLVITQTFHFKNWQPLKKVLIKDSSVPNTPLGKNMVEGDFWIYQV